MLVTTGWLRPGDEVHRQLRAAGLEVVHSSLHDRASTGRTLLDLVPGFDAIVAGTDPFTEQVFASAAPGLKVIGRTGVGFDNVDVDAATRHGVAVCPTPGVNRQSVAEHTMALMLNCARLIPQNMRSVRSGGWDQTSGRELNGATLGLVGLGAIGKAVATFGRCFGMRVIAHDPCFDHEFGRENGIEPVSLERLLAVSDFVSLHIFLNASTRHFIDAAALAGMKPGAYLINTARGGVVDEDALADALAAGRLAGAALDTTEREPLPADSRLRGLDNVIVTAHIGAATLEARARSGRRAAQSVIDVLANGRCDQAVNPEFAGARK